MPTLRKTMLSLNKTTMVAMGTQNHGDGDADDDEDDADAGYDGDGSSVVS